MVAIYDYTNFPIIKVDLSGSISNNTDFQSFTAPWLQLYTFKNNFEFEFVGEKSMFQ